MAGKISDDDSSVGSNGWDDMDDMDLALEGIDEQILLDSKGVDGSHVFVENNRFSVLPQSPSAIHPLNGVSMNDNKNNKNSLAVDSINNVVSAQKDSPILVANYCDDQHEDQNNNHVGSTASSVPPGNNKYVQQPLEKVDQNATTTQDNEVTSSKFFDVSSSKAAASLGSFWQKLAVTVAPTVDEMIPQTMNSVGNPKQMTNIRNGIEILEFSEMNNSVIDSPLASHVQPENQPFSKTTLDSELEKTNDNCTKVCAMNDEISLLRQHLHHSQELNSQQQHQESEQRIISLQRLLDAKEAEFNLFKTTTKHDSDSNALNETLGTMYSELQKQYLDDFNSQNMIIDVKSKQIKDLQESECQLRVKSIKLEQVHTDVTNSLQNEILSLITERDVLEKDLSTLSTLVQVLQNSESELRTISNQKVDDLTEQLKDSNLSLKEKDTEMQYMKSENDNLIQKTNELSHENYELQCTCDKLLQGNEELELQIEASIDTIDQQSQEIIMLREKVLLLESRESDYFEKSHDRNIVIAVEAESENNNLVQQLDEKSRETQNLLFENDSLKETIGSLIVERDSLIQQIQEVNDSADVMKSENDVVKANAEIEISNLLNHVNELKMKLNHGMTNKNEIDEIQDMYRNQEKQLSNEIHNLKDSLKNREAELLKLSKDLKRLLNDDDGIACVQVYENQSLLLLFENVMTKFQKSKEKCVLAERNLLELNILLDQSNEETKAQQLKIDELEGRAITAAHEQYNLSIQLEDAIIQHQDLERKYNKLKSEFELNNSKDADSVRIIAEKDLIIQDLHNQCNGLRVQLSAYMKNNDSDLNSFPEDLNENAFLTEENKEQNTTESKQYEILETEYNKLMTENEELYVQFAWLNAEYEKATQLSAVLKRDQTDGKALDTLDKGNDAMMKMSQELHLVRNEYTQLLAKLDAETNAKYDIIMERNNITKQKDEYEQSIANLKSTCLKFETELGERMNVMLEVEEKAKHTIAQLEKTAASLSSEVDSLTNTFSSTRILLASKESELENVTAELKTLMVSHEDLVAKTERELLLRQQTPIGSETDPESLRSYIVTLAEALEHAEMMHVKAVSDLAKEREIHANSLRKMSDSMKQFYSTVSYSDS